jgi:hypothetical protein
LAFGARRPSLCREKGSSTCTKSQLAPWNCIHGVGSLLEMLEFAATEFIELSHRFGLLLGQKQQPNPDVLGDCLSYLLEHGQKLGLQVTLEQLFSMIGEINQESPGSVVIVGRTLTVKGKLNSERSKYYVECLYSTMLAEMGSIQFRAIPRERSRYCDPKWLADGILMTKYPDTVDEFQRAGRCFAYGENTACIFHLMRVTEFYLKKVADSLNVPFHPNTWSEIGKHITREMEKKHQAKTDEWKSSEPFYAAILTDIQAISRGHRSPAIHELEKKYDEREASYMLTVIEEFALHVARNCPGTAEADPVK